MSKPVFLSSCLLMAATLLLVCPATAQQESSAAAAAEIVVTANRRSQGQDALVASTTVITRDEIVRSLAQNLNELLLGRAGIQLAQSGGAGSQTSLFLRGTESDHTLVLVDGVQMTTATGAAARLEYLSLDQIERIEVVRGSRSGVYGSEAIGGVIQIFTRQADSGEIGGSVRLGAGTEDSRNGAVSIGGGSGLGNWSVVYSRQDTDGIDARQGGSPDRDGYTNQSLSMQLDSRLTEWLGLNLAWSGFRAESDYDDGSIDADSQQFSARFAYRSNDAWQGWLSVESFAEANDNAGSFAATASETDTRTVRWQNDLNLADNAALSLGADYQEQQLNYASVGAAQSDDSRHNLGVYGIFLLDGESSNLELSLRGDDNERYGSHLTGSLGAGWELGERSRLRASLGSAFKAPNLIDLYVDFPDFFFFANPALQPEKSRSVEVGFDTRLAGVSLTLNLFHTRIRDLIGSDETFTTLANVERASIDGAELLAEVVLLDWALSAGLTLLDHENETTGAELLRRPDRTLSLQARRQFSRLEIGVNWLLQSGHRDIDPLSFGPSSVAGYGSVDLLLGYRLTDSLELRLRVGNLFDQHYTVVAGFNSYGRTARVSLDYRF